MPTNKSLRRLEHTKAQRVTTGVGRPRPEEGSEGSMTIRSTKEGIKFFVKYGNLWYTVANLVETITRKIHRVKKKPGNWLGDAGLQSGVGGALQAGDKLVFDAHSTRRQTSRGNTYIRGHSANTTYTGYTTGADGALTDALEFHVGGRGMMRMIENGSGSFLDLSTNSLVVNNIVCQAELSGVTLGDTKITLASDEITLMCGNENVLHLLEHATSGNTVTINGGTLTVSTTDNKILDISATLDDDSAGGSTEVFRLIKGNVDIDSGTGDDGWDNTYLMDLQTGETSKFNIDLAGNTTITGTANTADTPKLKLLGSHNGTDGPIFELSHVSSDSSEADGDKLGRIQFTGQDSANNATTYAEIEGLAGDVTTDTEAGSLRFKVITENASAPVLSTGFKLAGSDTNDEVDVWLGAGAASVTSVAGDLALSGDVLSSSGDLQVDCGGILKLDAHTTGDGEGVYFQMAGTRVADINVHHFATYLRMYENGGDSTDDYFDIGVFEHGRTEITTKDNAASAAHLEIDVDGHTKFDGTGVGFVRTTYADATNVTVDFRTGNKAHLDMTGGSISGTLTLQFPAVSGNFILVVQQDGSTRTINAFATKDEAGNTGDNDGAGDGAVRWAGGSAPDLTDGSNKRDILAFYWDATEEVCYGQASLNF